jgi:hypothetical protein
MNESTTITVVLTQNEHAAPRALAGIWLKEPEQVLSLAPRQLAEAALLGKTQARHDGERAHVDDAGAEAASPARSTPLADDGCGERRGGRLSGRLREPVAIQPRHGSIATLGSVPTIFL